MKIIELPHKIADYLCPVNGLCDMYEWKTGNRLPDDLVFYLQTGFTYLKQNNGEVKRLVFFGNGIGKRQYSFLEDIIGIRTSVSEGTTFKTALNKAINFIDSNKPVILFGLNMYHLPYFNNFYHKFNVPGHIILMVGYDDEKKIIYVQDNSKKEINSVPYDDLEKAWGEDFPGQSKKNALFALDFNENLPDVKTIINNGLRKRAELNLNPPIKSFGISGIRKLANEILNWENEMDEKSLKDCLINFVTFTASTVPELPQALRNYKTGIINPHKGARDKFADSLIREKDRLGNEKWVDAAQYFRESGELIEKITNILTDRIMNKNIKLDEIPLILSKFADNEERAFKLFL